MSQPLHQFQSEQMWSPWRCIYYLGGPFSRSTRGRPLGVWEYRFWLQLFGMVELRATAYQGGIPLRKGLQISSSRILVSTESDNSPVYTWTVCKLTVMVNWWVGHLTADKPAPLFSQTIWPWLTSWLLGDCALGTDHAKLTSSRW